MFQLEDPHYRHASRRSSIYASCAVATSQPLAAQAGLAMLQAGGNAADAAIAAAITLTVVEPNMNGIGGDAFAIIANNSDLHGFNGCGRSPAAWSPQRFAGYQTFPERGWETVTVPGAVDAWVQVSKRFGSLPFAQLFQHAIGYAREGFVVSPIVATGWAGAVELFGQLEGFRSTFMVDGRAPVAGERFRCPAMAETLDDIATSHGDSFYRGRLAQLIANDAANHNGALTAADLAGHQGYWTECLTQEFADLTVHEIPPNGQGIVTLLALGILEHLDIARYPALSADSVHLQIEALKAAFTAAHQHVADPAAMEVSPGQLLHPAYLARCASEIHHEHAGQPQAHSFGDKGTVYLAAADRDGMMVSWIQSNYHGFGSGAVVPATGISLHNRGSGFTLEPGHPNQVAGNKRPYHTIIPAVVSRAGRPLLAFGVMGAHHQPQGQVQVLINIFCHGYSPQQALDAPRWHLHEDFSVSLEDGLAELATPLAARGHALAAQAKAGLFGGGQAILRTDSGYVAGSDPRKDGQAVGY